MDVRDVVALDGAADPGGVAAAVARLLQRDAGAADRLAADPVLGAAVVAVLGAGRWLAPLVEAGGEALDVLADLARLAPAADDPVRAHGLAVLRAAARDLLGHDDLAATGALLAAAAATLLDRAFFEAGAAGVAVMGMGKLGAGELNYASDVDLLLVAPPGGVDEAAVRRALATARRAVRVDLALRPEGRDGALLRTLDGYVAHWEGWAEPWERQALLKCRSVAGDADVGDATAAAAAEQVWGRPFGAEELRAVRALKARAEQAVARRGLRERELKRGPGGIRDVEFAVQLLQLVHGPADPAVRPPATLDAVAELARGGYVDPADAGELTEGYRRLRAVEHRLQLADGAPAHVLPARAADLDRAARTLGFGADAGATAGEGLAAELRRLRSSMRAIHERLWFRPLLEAFAVTAQAATPGADPGDDGAVARARPLTAAAAADRLAAFGFDDAERTRIAVTELTRGLTRTSRLMQSLMPLVLDWLSTSPDPDLGLLSLRDLASGPGRGRALVDAFRDSPEVAQRVCRLVGTSRVVGEQLRRDPSLLGALGERDGLAPRPPAAVVEAARAAVGWRDGLDERRLALKRFTDHEGARIAAGDVLGVLDRPAVGRALTALARAAVEVAVEAVDPDVPLAVVALGRFGGGELSYSSDLDLAFATASSTPDDVAAAERATAAVLRVLRDGAPHLYDVDLALRPEGRQGGLVRSVEGWRAYLERWAEPWERLALSRADVVGGDPDVGATLLDIVDEWVWDRPVGDAERRAVRRAKARTEASRPRRSRAVAGGGRAAVADDPDFHLKHGRGGLADVELCTQLLQVTHGVKGRATAGALAALAEAGVLDAAEHDALAEAHAFCEAVRDRAFLVTGVDGDALPARTDHLGRLAASLDTTPTALRDDYRRLTRRARPVVERRFYGAG